LAEKDFDSFLLASEIKEMTKKLTPIIEEGDFILENKSLYSGENTLTFFISDIK
jgi:hypothetical protein